VLRSHSGCRIASWNKSRPNHRGSNIIVVGVLSIRHNQRIPGRHADANRFQISDSDELSFQKLVAESMENEILIEKSHPSFHMVWIFQWQEWKTDDALAIRSKGWRRKAAHAGSDS
jgi:hypothetical protein